jgi:hypothetical protein
MDDTKLQDLILRQLHSSPGREAVLLPSLFLPPIMLSNIFRIGGILKSKGYTTVPNRRLGGWHMRLTDAGVAYCEATPAAPSAPTPTKLR